MQHQSTDTKEYRLKRAIVEGLRLDIDPDSLTADTVLFSKEEGLRLDSLDAVELVTIIDRQFGVSIKNADEAKRAFTTFAGLLAYIEARTEA